MTRHDDCVCARVERQCSLAGDLAGGRSLCGHPMSLERTHARTTGAPGEPRPPTRPLDRSSKPRRASTQRQEELRPQWAGRQLSATGSERSERHGPARPEAHHQPPRPATSPGMHPTAISSERASHEGAGAKQHAVEAAGHAQALHRGHRTTARSERAQRPAHVPASRCEQRTDQATSTSTTSPSQPAAEHEQQGKQMA